MGKVGKQTITTKAWRERKRTNPKKQNLEDKRNVEIE